MRLSFLGALPLLLAAAVAQAQRSAQEIDASKLAGAPLRQPPAPVTPSR